jgi:hypothetical protein
MRLKDSGTNPHDLSPLAPKIAGSTHLIKSSMGSRKLGKRGQSTLSCSLFGAIDVDHEPVQTLTIPQASWGKGLGCSLHHIVEKE